MADKHPRDLPNIPELDKDYQLVRELGRGGTAVVYLARDRELGRDVAIKLIRPAHVRDEDAIARLLREARTIGKLQHPNIVMLLGTRRLGEHGLALILQYMPGQTLKDQIQAKGPFAFEDVERILRDLGGALQYAHAQRIVHRDIKPENIYLDDALSLARLADFGIARAWDSDSGLTLPGTAIGTPAYMSPEQVDGKELDGRSDIYSLGLVGYEMLTGRQPWAGEGLYNVIYKQKHEALPSISGSRPNTPKNLLDAIGKAIEKAPSDRWKDAGDFLKALAEGSTLPPVSGEPVGVVEPEAGWETSLDAIESGVATSTEPSGPGEHRLGRRALMGAGVAVIALLGVALLSISIGGRSGFVLDSLGSMATGAWAILTGEVESVDPLSGEGTLGGGSDVEPMPDSEGLIRVGSEGTSDGVGPPRDGIGAAAGRAAMLEVLGGDRQLGVPGAPLPLPLQVRVTDQEGAGLGGVSIVFEVMSGGGSSTPDRVVSAPDGTASARWTLGSEGEDGQMLIAWAEGLEDEGAVFLSFVEGSVAVAPIPAAAEVVSGGSQQGTAGEELPEPLSVRVLGEEGAPLEGVLVRFRVEIGEGQVSPATAMTDGTGEATATWLLGPSAGEQAVVADVEGAPGVSIQFQAEAEAAGLSAAAAVVTGGTHSCSLRGDGSLLCWGGNADGQLGDGSPAGTLVPGGPMESASFARVASGLGHVCALTLQGEGYCWGSNTQGQLGTGSRTSARQPTPVSGSTTFSALTAGVSHTCGLDAAGAAYCWGSNADGQLGTGSPQQNVPSRAGGTGLFSQISAGWRHTCALDRQGQAYCWGANDSGQLGSEAGGGGPTPRQVTGGIRFRALAAGNAHTCGLAIDERILCWGANDAGQLGDGTNQGRSEPQPVATTARFAAVAAGGVHACGLTVDGGVMCWGTNVYGQVGDGTTQARSSPVPVGGFERFRQIGAFGSHTCGRTLSGAIRCWGYNVEGQIGDGTRENRLVPTPVMNAGP